MTKVEVVDGQTVIRIPVQQRSGLDKPQNVDLLEVGDTATFRRTVTEADIALFAGATGDTNPYHFDDEYAKKGRFGKRIAHGMLVTGFISTVLGTILPGPGTIYLSQTLFFRRPVFIGDTITAVVEVKAIKPDRPIVTLKTSCINQGGEHVVDGEATVLVEFVDLN